jgi:hypothetical protein
MRLLFVDREMTERTVLPHRDVLLVGPMVTLLARPHRREVHQRAARDDADGKFGLTGRTHAHPVGKINVLNESSLST